MKFNYGDKKGYDVWLKPDRLSSWVDGIFAFAMTLLVITIDVPKVPASELKNALLGNLHNFWVYVLSFLLLGVFWVHHQKLFRHIERVSDGFLWLNIFKMMFVVFIPFTTRLTGDYQSSVAAHFLFHMNLLVVSLFICLLLVVAYKTGLINRESFQVKEFIINYSLVPVASLSALILTFIAFRYSSYAYAGIPLLRRILIYAFRQDCQKVKEKNNAPR